MKIDNSVLMKLLAYWWWTLPALLVLTCRGTMPAGRRTRTPSPRRCPPAATRTSSAGWTPSWETLWTSPACAAHPTAASRSQTCCVVKYVSVPTRNFELACWFFAKLSQKWYILFLTLFMEIFGLELYLCKFYTIATMEMISSCSNYINLIFLFYLNCKVIFFFCLFLILNKMFFHAINITFLAPFNYNSHLALKVE